MNAVTRPRGPRVVRPRSPLSLLRTWVAPDVFDFWASRLHPTWTWERPLARIVARQAQSRDAVTLLLQPNRHWRGFRPGQHVNLGVEIDGVRMTRSYSLSDAPRADGRIAVTVKHIEGGRMSRHLCQDARVGDVVDLGQAFGEMTWPQGADGAWLFLAAGSGITPLMSLLRAHVANGASTPLMLLYWARSRDELCFVDELRALAKQHPNFVVHFVLTRESTLMDGEHRGRIDAALLSSLVSDLGDRDVYACGPGGFVDSARALAGANARSFAAEAFTPPARLIEEGGHVEVTLAASGRTLSVPRGQSLLTALEGQGLKLASGCRMGICNTCACGKVSGTTRHLHTGDAIGEPVSALRLCVNAASSDLVLDL
ncbi:ferredoxin reductase [Lysobacter sp. S4-A87]|uniref:ferredoxin reductase n=1 Tax=Lysobacter sp. S4-A87 TaxID=2925843 RepID=UPI001F534B85|nr:ferredoxin reductase [Lysobacter sp. S4-A87]UNK48292.1 ferredoxin reductase [Lysobacter sp. S4-A87]